MPWEHTESRNEKRGIGRGIHGKNLVQDNLCFSYQWDIDCINGFLKKDKKLGYYPDNGLFFEDLCKLADDTLFSKIENNPNHVL